jgi:hypothetical protein
MPQVVHAEGVPLADGESAAAIEAYCQLAVGPLRMATASVRASPGGAAAAPPAAAPAGDAGEAGHHHCCCLPTCCLHHQHDYHHHGYDCLAALLHCDC